MELIIISTIKYFMPHKSCKKDQSHILLYVLSVVLKELISEFLVTIFIQKSSSAE